MFHRIQQLTIAFVGICWCGCGATAQTNARAQRVDIELEMVLIEPGTFVMGAPKVERVSRYETLPEPTPPHEVTLTTPYYLSAYEITNEQFKSVMKGEIEGYGALGDPTLPVELVTWEAAIKFCEKLNEMPASKAAGKIYRLPTEAEWEYACRAGSKSTYCFGDSKEQLHAYAWFTDREEQEQPANRMQPVGKKKPNAWGLYDMHGNVAEFCQDYFGSYPTGPATDPRGPKDGYERVVRGGSYNDSPLKCRSANREKMSGAMTGVGFRVAMSLASQIKPTKAVQWVPLSDFDRSSDLDHRSRSGPMLPTRSLDYEAMKESFWYVSALLANGADPNAMSSDGRPILFHAIDDAKTEEDTMRSNWQIEDQEREFRKLPPLTRDPPRPTRLEALLQAGADPNVRDGRGQPALHYALSLFQQNAVKCLYEYGADPNQTNSAGLNASEFSRDVTGRSGYLEGALFQAIASSKSGERIEPPRVVRNPVQQLGESNFRMPTGGVAITFSADGKQIVAGEREHVIRVFDAVTGARNSAIDIRQDLKSNHYIWSLGSIPNSRIVFVGGGIGDPLRFWNIDTGIEVLRLDFRCVQASVSPDGKHLFTGDYLCQIESTEPLKLAATAREFRGNYDQRIQVRSSFFTYDSRYLVFVNDQQVRAWDVTTDEVVTLKGLSPKTLRSIRWGDLAEAFQIQTDHAPKELVAIRANQAAFLSSRPEVLATCEPILGKLQSNSGYCVVALSPDNRYLATLDSSARIEVYDLSDGTVRNEQTGHHAPPIAVAISGDGKWIASGAGDGKVILWNKASSTIVRTVLINSPVHALCFHVDNKALAIGADSGVHVHDVASGETKQWKVAGKVTSLQVDEERNALIVLARKLELRDWKSGDLLSSAPAGEAEGGKIAYAQKNLVVGSLLSRGNRAVMNSVWSIENKELKAMPAPNVFMQTDKEEQGLTPFRSIALSPDGKYAALPTRWGGIQLWDLDKQAAVTRPSTHFQGNMRAIMDIEFTFDSQYMVAGCGDGTARVWEVATGRQLLTFDADVHSISDFALHPDGTLVTANNDGTIHVWNIER